MEGLAKGLLNVALDHFQRGNDDDDADRRDEQSRSTWAQVVSNDPDNTQPSSYSNAAQVSSSFLH